MLPGRWLGLLFLLFCIASLLLWSELPNHAKWLQNVSDQEVRHRFKESGIKLKATHLSDECTQKMLRWKAFTKVNGNHAESMPNCDELNWTREDAMNLLFASWLTKDTIIAEPFCFAISTSSVLESAPDVDAFLTRNSIFEPVYEAFELQNKRLDENQEAWK